MLNIHEMGCRQCSEIEPSEEDSNKKPIQDKVCQEKAGFRTVAGVFAEDAIDLLKSFYGAGNPNGTKYLQFKKLAIFTQWARFLL